MPKHWKSKITPLFAGIMATLTFLSIASAWFLAVELRQLSDVALVPATALVVLNTISYFVLGAYDLLPSRWRPTYDRVVDSMSDEFPENIHIV